MESSNERTVIMFINFAETDARSAYAWLAATVTPRPVAWVSTLSKKGIANLAPFSFFQVLTGRPPTIMISPLVNSDGSMKDTPRNIRDTGEFVVNLVPFPLVGTMSETSFSYNGDTSEFETLGIQRLDSQLVKPARVKDVPVSFECRLARFIPYPEEHPSCHVIFGEVLAAHIDELILDSSNRVDPNKLDLVSRMGGNWYGRTQAIENFELERPKGWAK